MVNFKRYNEYIISFSNKFLSDFLLDKEVFVASIKNYVVNFYLTDRPQMYSVKIGNDKIRFHKVDVKDNNKSSQKGKRIIIFFLINTPDGFNTIYPAFCFSTQEEKVYNKKLKNVAFVKSLRLKLEKYNSDNENNIILD